MFRKALPKAQIQVTTNGAKMRNGNMLYALRALFNAGVNFVILDTYEPERTDLRKQVFSSKLTKEGIKVIDYQKDTTLSPYHNHKNKISNTVFVFDDLSIVSGDIRQRLLHNYAGNSKSIPPTSSPLVKKCARPFRELAVCWNGDVCICCEDAGHEFVCGNVFQPKQTLQTVWNNPPFQAVRKLLFHKNRSFSPCHRCDYNGGMRLGFLEQQAEPNLIAHTIINEVILKSKTGKLNSLPINY